MRIRFIAIPLALLLALPVGASIGLTKKETLHDAVVVLDGLTSAPAKGIPQELLPKVDCILIFPSPTQSAFIVRGKGDYGVVSCRQPDGKVGSAPIYTVDGTSIGFQIGGQSANVVMLIITSSLPPPRGIGAGNGRDAEGRHDAMSRL